MEPQLLTSKTARQISSFLLERLDIVDNSNSKDLNDNEQIEQRELDKLILESVYGSCKGSWE